MTSRHDRLRPVLGALACLALTGCAGQGSFGDQARQNARGQAEPTGGTWRTVVLSSGGDIQVPPPPAAGSPEERAEIQELLSLRGRGGGDVAEIRRWDAGACTSWNEIARKLVAKHKTSPPKAARVYALVSVAQYDSLVASWKAKYQYKRRRPAQADKGLTPQVPPPADYGYPSEHAAVAAASSKVLAALYPSEASTLQETAASHTESRLRALVSFRSDLEAGTAVGDEVARRVLDHGASDGSDVPWSGQIPAGPGKWRSTQNPPAPPLLPAWGNVRGWLVQANQMQVPPPPAFDSAEFQSAVSEVRQISDSRTPEQLRIAEFWADGAGTSTPPGHWNEILCEILGKERKNELRAARALALTNMALMDAGVCCWDVKYKHWLIRPSQADPAITTPVGLPNFPAYTSGHSTFSGAAATVMGRLFPNEAGRLDAMAQEASLSRMYGGIHYRFDCEEGLSMGRQIGLLAAQWGAADATP